MKKLALLCILLVFLVSGCAKVSYSSEFEGVPIYPGTELFASNEYDNMVSEMYFGMYVNGDIEKVRKFFEKNIDSSIWTMKDIDRPMTGHNIDKIYGYTIKSKDRNATLIMTYSNSDKVGESISVTITGNKLK